MAPLDGAIHQASVPGPIEVCHPPGVAARFEVPFISALTQHIACERTHSAGMSSHVFPPSVKCHRSLGEAGLMTNIPAAPGVTFVDNPHAPDIFVDAATGWFSKDGLMRITFESHRASHISSPGPINRV